jgi:hypothetical protein
MSGFSDDSRGLVVAANSRAASDDTGSDKYDLVDHSRKNISSHSGKRGGTDNIGDSKGRRILGFHVNPKEMSVIPSRKPHSSTVVSTLPVPTAGFIMDPERRIVKPIKRTRIATRTSVSAKQIASLSGTIENQCEVIAPVLTPIFTGTKTITIAP